MTLLIQTIVLNTFNYKAGISFKNKGRLYFFEVETHKMLVF
jgi:hypothetical protein